MGGVYERDGVTFQYPETWRLESEETPDGWSVSVNSPETAFLLVTLRADASSLVQVVEEALNAFKSEYKLLDSTQVVETLAGFPALGHDIDFLTLDTTIYAWTRCIDTQAGPLMVMGQASEYDRAVNEPVLKAIAKSIFILD